MAIQVGQIMNVIVLEKPGGKRTGKTLPVEVEAIVFHHFPRSAIRSVRVCTIDCPYRRQWVDPRYLVPIAEPAAV